MFTLIDPVLDSTGSDEAGQWQKQSWVDFWRWGFSDVRDDGIKDALAEVIAKVMLDWGPAMMSPDELEIFRISSLIAANGWHTSDNRRGYDA